MKQTSKNNEEQFFFYFHIDDFSTRHGAVSVSQKLLFLEESAPPLCREQKHLLLILPSPSLSNAVGQKGGINSWSKNSVYVQLIIFSVEFNIIQIKHMIPAYVIVLCTHKRKCFIPHHHSPLLLGELEIATDVFLKVLSLRQETQSCQKTS